VELASVLGYEMVAFLRNTWVYLLDLVLRPKLLEMLSLKRWKRDSESRRDVGKIKKARNKKFGLQGLIAMTISLEIILSHF
jgi:hypothetical protein